jgi:hypothetical protein
MQGSTVGGIGKADEDSRFRAKTKPKANKRKEALRSDMSAVRLSLLSLILIRNKRLSMRFICAGSRSC